MAAQLARSRPVRRTSRAPASEPSPRQSRRPGQRLSDGSLVVRGAVPEQARFPVPLSIRTCGLPAYGLPMGFLTWLRCPRIADSASEPVEPVPVEPVFGPHARVILSNPAAPRFSRTGATPCEPGPAFRTQHVVMVGEPTPGHGNDAQLSTSEMVMSPPPLSTVIWSPDDALCGTVTRSSPRSVVVLTR
jgi:hypothetical protein